MDPRSHSGHRERLMQRFSRGGVCGMHDYEIVELLLSFAIPRKDTKGIAKELCARYGSISGILQAPGQDLLEVDGLGPRSVQFIRLTGEMLLYCLKERFERGSVITHRDDVETWLRFHFGHKREEYIAALFLDTAHHILKTTIVAEGTVNQCMLFPRTIVERALQTGAAAVILAHNHPGGTLEPSAADWSITRKLIAACEHLDISVLDHLIISREEVVSLRSKPQWPIHASTRRGM